MSRRGKHQGPDQGPGRDKRREEIARRKHREEPAGDRPPGWWSSKWPIIKPVLIFTGVMCAYYSIDYMAKLVESPVFIRYLESIASVSAGLLRLCGYDASASGTVIASPGFSVQIVRGCDALEPTAAFMAAVIASPVGLRRKLPGLAVGIPALLTINLVRVVSLFYIGMNWRSWFDTMHYEVWQAAFIVLAVAFWAIWVQWATRERTGNPK